MIQDLSRSPDESAPPRVSIGLPTYNSRRFLQERIDSILAQDFRDWELVVVEG